MKITKDLLTPEHGFERGILLHMTIEVDVNGTIEEDFAVFDQLTEDLFPPNERSDDCFDDGRPWPAIRLIGESLVRGEHAFTFDEIVTIRPLSGKQSIWNHAPRESGILVRQKGTEPGRSSFSFCANGTPVMLNSSDSIEKRPWWAKESMNENN